MTIDLDHLLDEQVYPALFERLDTAFPEFVWVQRGSHWVATSWPSEFPLAVNDQRPGRLMVYADRPWWIKVHGHEGVRFLDLVAGGTRPTGPDFVAAVTALCERAGVPPPQRSLTPEQQQRMAQADLRRRILAATMEWGRSRLWSDEGREALRYLVDGRGLTEKEISDLGLGLYTRTWDLRAHLQGASFTAADVKASGAAVLWTRLEGYVLIPWADDRGHPLTIYGRWHSKTAPDRTPKTIALPGRDTKASPLLFDRARSEGHRDVVLVEGLFDALLLHARGDHRVIAAVAAQLSRLQVETMVKHRVRSVCICGDPDGGGEAGTLANIASLDKASIAALVVPRLPDGLDPDEYVLAHGIEAWFDLVSHSVHAYEFMARQLVAKHPDQNALSVVALLDEAEAYANSIAGDRQAELDRFFWPVIAEAVGTDPELLREGRRVQQRKELAQALAVKAGELGRVGSQEAAEALADQLEELRAISSPTLKISGGTIEEHLHDFQSTDTGGEIEFGLGELAITYGELLLLIGPQKIAKSGLACHAVGQAVRRGVPAVYFTYEMPAREVWTRLIAPQVWVGGWNLWYGRVLNGKLTDEERRSYIRTASEFPRDLVRVFQPSPAQGQGDIAWLCGAVEALAQQWGEPPLVIVDYLQRARMNDQKERRLEVGEVAYTLRELTDRLRLPTIAISSVARGKYPVARKKKADGWVLPAQDAAKESGDIEYSATSVYALWPTEETYDLYIAGDASWGGNDRISVDLYRLLHRHGGNGPRILHLELTPGPGTFAEVARNIEKGWGRPDDQEEGPCPRRTL